MLFGKKKKLSKYLAEKQATQCLTPFDRILEDYLSGALKKRLGRLTMKQIEICVDWLEDYQCINIQGKSKGCYFDIQVEPSGFSIAYDKDEPENAVEFPLEDASVFYKIIEGAIANIK